MNVWTNRLCSLGRSQEEIPLFCCFQQKGQSLPDIFMFLGDILHIQKANNSSYRVSEYLWNVSVLIHLVIEKYSSVRVISSKLTFSSYWWSTHKSCIKFHLSFSKEHNVYAAVSLWRTTLTSDNEVHMLRTYTSPISSHNFLEPHKSSSWWKSEISYNNKQRSEERKIYFRMSYSKVILSETT